MATIGTYGNPAISSYVIDADGYFVATNVEVALAEIYERFSDADNVYLDQLGTPTYRSVQDWVDVTQCAGKFTDNVITAHAPANGTVDIAAGSGFIKTSAASGIGETLFFDWEAVDGLALTNNDTNYIFVDYNIVTGAITIQTTTNRATIDGRTEFTLGRVYRIGNETHIVNSGTRLDEHERLNHERLLHVRGFERGEGGTIAEVGTRELSSTEGIFYLGSNRIVTPAQNTTPAGGDTFDYWYRDGVGGWTRTTGNTQIDNQNYDANNAAGPQALTANRYGVFWVYIDMDGHIIVLYGQGDYTLANAEDASPPASIPEFCAEFCVLAAKIVIQKAAAAFTSIVSAYITYFPTTNPANHNDLGALQGGVAGEYYHLTAAQHTELTSWLDDVVLSATGQVQINSVGAGTQNVIGITPQSALAGAGTVWKGIHMDGAALDPGVANIDIYGIHIDLTGVAMGTNPDIWGVNVQLPGAYGTGTEIAGYFAGDGRTVSLCNDTYAIQTSGDIDVTGDIIVSGSVDGVDISLISLSNMPAAASGNIDCGTQAITNVGNVDGVDVSAIIAFTTITGITNDVVADALTDTLTLASGNAILTIVGTTATDTITFTIVEAQISHDNIGGVSADDHHAQSHALTSHSDVSLADPDADQIVFWDDSDSQFEFLIANTGLSIAGNNLNCDITQYTDGLARTACLEDDVYGAGWNGDITHAPTQNAVYDKINAIDTLIAANTTVAEVEAIIDAEIVGGQSIDNAIDVLIGNHAGLPNAHHAQSHTIVSHSDATLADPGADQIVFWDDSDSQFEFLVANTGLSIVGNNLNCDITQYIDADAVAAVLADDAYVKIVGDTMTGLLTLTHAVAGMIDLNPANTGSQNVIDITPSASLVAGSTWKGTYIDTNALDPATGAGCSIIGHDVYFGTIASVDHDATLIAFKATGSLSDSDYLFAAYPTEKTGNYVANMFFSYAVLVLSKTAIYRGLLIDWAGVTRDAEAPRLEGVKVQLPADYTNFGTSFAGYFSGDGRSVTICDTTYALNVSGAMNLVGAITGVTTLAMGGALSGITTLSMSGQLTNTLAIGNPPFVITSTTVVPNLNVDQVDGYDMDQDVLQASSPTFVGLTLSGAIATPTTITTSGNITCGGDLIIADLTFKATVGSPQVIECDDSIIWNFNAAGDLALNLDNVGAGSFSLLSRKIGILGDPGAPNAFVMNSMLDEDDMASDSNTAVASQQSIKAYVDAQIGAENELSEMNDVTIAGLADNHVLTYDNATSKWINEAQSALTLDGAALATLTTISMSGQLTSSLAIGTPPFVITSTTVVPNLNVDKVDGYDLDQSLLQADSPTFVGLTLSGAISGATTISAGGTYFQVDASGNIILSVADATAIATIQDSATLELKGKYWTGAATADVAMFIGTDVTVTTPEYEFFIKREDLTKVFSVDELGNGMFLGALAVGGAITGVTTLTTSGNITCGGDLIIADLTFKATVGSPQVIECDDSIIWNFNAAGDLALNLDNVGAGSFSLLSRKIGILGDPGAPNAFVMNSMLDEDDMASDSNTAVASQQSIKAYVDAQIGAENELSEMNDVTIAGLADNHVLTYDNATSKWINEAQSALTGVDHDAITNFVADEHVAHSGVTITAGVGLSGGGTIAANRTIDCDITQYTDALARTACLEDDVYGAGWDADVTHAPTQNAVYDKIAAMDTLIAANTTPAEAVAAVVAESPLALTNALNIGSIVAGVADYDKFLVSDGGLVKFRTGAEVLSDIGASATGHTHTHASTTGRTANDHHAQSHTLISHSDVSLAAPGADRIVFWDHSDTTFEFLVANTGLSIAGNNLNCDITQYTDALARTACVEDAVYGAGWNGDLTHAPSQNAVYDKIAAMDILIAANTTVAEVEAIIDAEIVGGQSIDNAIDVLIGNHAGLPNVHHAQSHTLISHSDVSLAAPGADRIVFWDHSDTTFEFLVANTGLSIAGNNLNCDITQYTNAMAVAAVLADDAYVKNTSDTMTGTLTAGGVIPVDDLSDDLGSGTKTWQDIFVLNIKDSAGAICAYTGGGRLYLNAGTGVNDIDTVMAGAPTHDQLLTASAIKTYADAAGGAPHDIASHTDITATGPQLESLTMFGNANKAWVPCIFELTNVVGKVTSSGWTIRNVDDTDVMLQFRLPIPTNKNGLKLYVDAIRVGIQDADAGDYLTQVRVRGVVFDASVDIHNDPDNYTAQQEYSELLSDGLEDCSVYTNVIVNVYLFCTNASDIDIVYANLRCYYAA